MARTRRLAKLTRPRLHRTVARERLFSVLDTAAGSPLTWLEGPPGSGKTTALVSYLESRHLEPLWYRLDRMDGDPSAFFHHLTESTAWAAPRARRKLPSFGPEFQADPVVFAHRYFRALFTHLPRDVVPVLDDYHELADDSDVHRVLTAAIAEIPNGHRLLVASRTPPPAEFARWELAGALAKVNWSDLRLSAEETRSVAASRGHPLSATAARDLHARADGWVAAICLWLDRKDSARPFAQGKASPGPEPLFRYLAAEVLDGVEPALRHCLLATCLVPSFTAAEAEQLSGNAEAGRIVDDLYRRQLFIERSPGGAWTYRYHDLFRAFLQERLRSHRDDESLARESAHAGGVLLASGRPEEAFPLLVQGKDWPAALVAFVRAAPSLLKQGRWRMLRDWSERLAPEHLESDPWVLYWRGRALTLQDPAAAMRSLSGACERFRADSDLRGEALAVAGVLDALHFDVKAFDRIPPWLQRLVTLTGAGLPPLAVDEDLQIHAAVMVSSSHLCRPGAGLDNAVRRVIALLEDSHEPNLVLSVANMVHYYAGHCLDESAHAAAAAAARSQFGRHDISADRLSLYWLAEGHAHYTFGRFRQALECFDRTDAVISENALRNRRLVAGTWRIQCQALAGDVRGARETLKSLEPHAPTLPGFVEALFLWSCGVVEHRAGNLERSIELGSRAVTLNQQNGSSISSVLWLPRLAVRLLEAGRASEANDTLDDPVLTAESIAYARQEAGVGLLRAWISLKDGDMTGARTSLRRALERAQDARECTRLLWFLPPLDALLPFALEQDIEVETVRRLIDRFGIAPPARRCEQWPWPIRIVTLGGFQVTVDGKPLAFGRKVPRRTLALLVALIAEGGRQVAEFRLCDLLWPELEGDAAHESYSAALHRLRRLLGGNDSILQAGRTLSLNGARCFVDVWELEAALDAQGSLQRAIDLYRGPFMPGEDASYAIARRRFLRTRMARAIQGYRSSPGREAPIGTVEELRARVAAIDPDIFPDRLKEDDHAAPAG
ncbi:MAG: hypothetical protein IPK20_18185 [Betaproteobacteria bacterium]|nr:hypothetical protein [Betaproteobacteria bacterium]